MKPHTDLYTPSQLIEKHPELGDVWNDRYIGYLLMLRLVNGYKCRRTCYVSEKDVMYLFATWRGINIVCGKIDLMTPKQFLLRHRKIARIWNERSLGYLLMLQLVKGKKLKRGCLVSEAYVVSLFKDRFSVDAA